MSSVGTLDQAARPPRSRRRPTALSRAAFTVGSVAAALGALALIGKYLPQSGLTPLHSKLTDKGMVALLSERGCS